MSILNKKVIVYDLETDALNTAEKYDSNGNIVEVIANAVELASLAIDLRKLEIIPGSEFEVKMRPPDIDEPNYLLKPGYGTKPRKSTVEFHAKLHYGKASEANIQKVLADWRTYMPAKEGYQLWDDWLHQWNPEKKYQKNVILAGQNNKNFDTPIIKHWLEKFGIPFRPDKRMEYDLYDFSRAWFPFAPSAPQNYKLDTLRKFFNMSTVGAHTALADIYTTAELLIRFFKLHKTFALRVKDFNPEGT